MNSRQLLFTMLVGVSVAFCSASRTPAIADESSVAPIFAKIKPSLAIIANSEGVGTAFCISSTAAASYYLTNAHVVGNDRTVTVFRQFPKVTQMTGTVVAIGTSGDPDLAVVKVDVGNVPPLRLKLEDLREGDPIANAGYPSAQYTLAHMTGALTPSVHIGTIAAIENRGGVVEFDAQSLPGNSGGPLFDPRTGAVVGVVQAKLKGSTDANIAIGISRVVAPFLNKSQISYSRASFEAEPEAPNTENDNNSGVIRNLPGANSVVVLYDTSRATGNDVENTISAAAVDFAEKFSRVFHVRAMAVNSSMGDAAAIGQIARENNSLIAITYNCSFRSLSTFTNAYGTYITWNFSLQSSAIDSYGQVWASSGKREKTVKSARDVRSAIISSLADLNDQILDALPLQKMDDGTRTNLFRYALPMANGAKRSFVNLRPSEGGAKAIVLDFSVAVDAGLQTGDLVLSINGVPTEGKSQEDLTNLLLAASSSGAYDLVIELADGKRQHIKFEAKDLRWYVDHRETHASQ